MSNVNGCIQYEVKVDEKKVSVSTIDAASYVLTKLLGKQQWHPSELSYFCILIVCCSNVGVVKLRFKILKH